MWEWRKNFIVPTGFLSQLQARIWRYFLIRVGEKGVWNATCNNKLYKSPGKLVLAKCRLQEVAYV